ncbi:MAG: 2Fe-2S iron-sulfur cluster binding domain-containing protein [Leucobacter sp.]|nr:2Fe-2S iron-sulfur cluster binding domain-containing protein [Leucobacter sp.]
MPKITFISPDASSRELEAEPGQSVMRASIVNSIGGIIGECGGQAMCATCHVYVEGVEGALPVLGDDEDEMLYCVASGREENSRLGCQLTAGDDFEEIVVRLPESQV